MTSCVSDVGAISAVRRFKAFCTWALSFTFDDVTNDPQLLALFGQAHA